MSARKDTIDDGTIPRFETFVTNRRSARVLGFAVGLAAPLLLAGLVVVSWTGTGLGEEPVKPEPVYTVF
ncbi:MAG: hypothetical protein MUF73_05385 [Rhodobacteraceae bacterium]|jgi:hypothetical protein|nr:hypothetical protein [Paracoccaceae bacterium]